MKSAPESSYIINLQRFIFLVFSTAMLLCIIATPFSRKSYILVALIIILIYVLIDSINEYWTLCYGHSLRQSFNAEWQKSETKELCEKYHIIGGFRFFCVILAVLCIVCIFYVVFMELYLGSFPLKYNVELRNLIINCAGALIGCIPAYLALTHSRKELKEQHTQALESRRCSVMPVVDLTILPLIEYPSAEEFSKYAAIISDDTGKWFAPTPRNFPATAYQRFPNRYASFYVRNIGLGPAINATITNNNVTLFDGEIPTASDVTLIMEVVLPTSTASKSYNFKICYQDVFLNLYETTYALSWSPRGFSDATTTPPKLIKRSDAFQI